MNKKKNLITILMVVLSLNFSVAQIIKKKVIDKGSSGAYSAIAVTEKTLPDFVVYRPENLKKAVEKHDRLPVLIWANGGCMDSSIHQERILSEIASHGYVVVAIGKLQMTVEEREHLPTPDDEMLKGLNWISKQAKTKGSDYYKSVNLDKIAAGGHSCGGAQTFRIADDSRIKTYMILNAGMGEMEMAGASSKSLQNLHAPTIFMIGGESDIAYKNAVLDYNRINHVPVVFANHLTAGHTATFSEQYGGSFGQMSVDWLDWQFKSKDHSNIFLKNDLTKYPGWTIESKGFNQYKKSISEVFSKPELEFICELKVTIDSPIHLGQTPKGERVIIPISGGSFEGPNMKGEVLKGGADYQYVNNDLGRTELEAIYNIKTDDGVLIHVRNTGLLHVSKDENLNLGTIYFRATPKFEAPIDSKYAWLNNALFICKPEGKDGYISIQVWKVS